MVASAAGYWRDRFALSLDLRSKPDLRSLFERRSSINFRSSWDRVSAPPLRRSLPDRRSWLARLLSLVIAASPLATHNRNGR